MRDLHSASFESTLLRYRGSIAKGGSIMPEQQVIRRAKAKARHGRAPSTQAGEFVREEIEHIRAGKHGARSTKQAIAIGLSKARRAGVALPPREGTAATQKIRHRSQRHSSRRRSRATLEALQREPSSAASHQALSTHAHRIARQHGQKARRQAARKAVHTKGPKMLKDAAKKAAKTRQGI
jgi:hypothetical protein